MPKLFQRALPFILPFAIVLATVSIVACGSERCITCPEEVDNKPPPSPTPSPSARPIREPRPERDPRTL